MKKILKYMMHALIFAAGIFLVMFAFGVAKNEGYTLKTIPELVVFLAAGHLLVIMIVFSLIKEIKGKDNNKTLNMCLIGTSFFPFAHFVTLFVANCFGGNPLPYLASSITSIASCVLFVMALVYEEKKKPAKCLWATATILLPLVFAFNAVSLFNDPVNINLAIGLIIGFVPCVIKTYLSFKK